MGESKLTFVSVSPHTHTFAGVRRSHSVRPSSPRPMAIPLSSRFCTVVQKRETCDGSDRQLEFVLTVAVPPRKGSIVISTKSVIATFFTTVKWAACDTSMGPRFPWGLVARWSSPGPFSRNSETRRSPKRCSSQQISAKAMPRHYKIFLVPPRDYGPAWLFSTSLAGRTKLRSRPRPLKSRRQRPSNFEGRFAPSP